MNNSAAAALTDSNITWLLILGFCGVGVGFVLDSRSRFRREEAAALEGKGGGRPFLWKLPKVVLAVLFVGYGVHGLLAGEVWLPGRSGPGIHLRDSAVLLFFVATLCAAVCVGADVLKHFAGEEKRGRYKVLMCASGFLGWAVLGAAFALGFHQLWRGVGASMVR